MTLASGNEEVGSGDVAKCLWPKGHTFWWTGSPGSFYQQ